MSCPQHDRAGLPDAGQDDAFRQSAAIPHKPVRYRSTLEQRGTRAEGAPFAQALHGRREGVKRLHRLKPPNAQQGVFSNFSAGPHGLQFGNGQLNRTRTMRRWAVLAGRRQHAPPTGARYVITQPCYVTTLPCKRAVSASWV